jgi:hypothetical protein
MNSYGRTHEDTVSRTLNLPDSLLWFETSDEKELSAATLGEIRMFQPIRLQIVFKHALRDFRDAGKHAGN